MLEYRIPLQLTQWMWLPVQSVIHVITMHTEESNHSFCQNGFNMLKYCIMLHPLHITVQIRYTTILSSSIHSPSKHVILCSLLLLSNLCRNCEHLIMEIKLGFVFRYKYLHYVMCFELISINLQHFLF